jgi:ABC-type Mn2+/Zn2+ transport system ATPase subunit
LTPSSAEPILPLVQLRRASLGYGGKPVLPPLDLDLLRGDFLGLVGPNGSGKTTILRAILGLIEPLSGSVVRTDPRLRFGYVPQRKALDAGWPFRTMDVVLMGLLDRVGLLRRPGPEHRTAALEALERVGIRELAGDSFDTLSGGQRQRTLIARALAGRPNALLLDEPTAGMDLPGTRAILSLLRRFHGEGLTILLVTHRLNEVANTARRVAVLMADGLRVGPTREILDPEVLSQLYGVQVRAVEVGGRTVILEDEARNA